MDFSKNNFFDKFLKKNLFSLVKECINIALKEKGVEIKKKKDGSLITKADKDIHSLIFYKLSKLYPDIPIISEEGEFNKKSFLQKIYWLIDPIDGTSSYAAGKDGYTINIALIQDGIPTLGIIAHPPSNAIWYGENKNAIVSIEGNEKKLSVGKFNKNNIKIVVSKNCDLMTKSFVSKIAYTKISYYSSSIKFCKIAEGEANFYPRLKGINKWDIAAGDAILRAAGGMVINENGKAIFYNNARTDTGKFFALSSKSVWESCKKLHFEFTL